jgi:hypothetical protein
VITTLGRAVEPSRTIGIRADEVAWALNDRVPLRPSQDGTAVSTA